MGRRQKGLTIQAFVLVIGALAVVLAIIGIVFQLLDLPRYPKASKQAISGDAAAVKQQLTKLIQRCWEEHDFGDATVSADCRLLAINTTERISSDELTTAIQNRRLRQQFQATNISNGTYKLMYDGKQGSVQLIAFPS